MSGYFLQLNPSSVSVQEYNRAHPNYNWATASQAFTYEGFTVNYGPIANTQQGYPKLYVHSINNLLPTDSIRVYGYSPADQASHYGHSSRVKPIYNDSQNNSSSEVETIFLYRN